MTMRGGYSALAESEERASGSDTAVHGGTEMEEQPPPSIIEVREEDEATRVAFKMQRDEDDKMRRHKALWRYYLKKDIAGVRCLRKGVIVMSVLMVGAIILTILMGW
eukprot:Hpha_TRINITY_DN26918_c0_g1::TRINITY_DN26918_c0_g1_i1::g.24843::m.24843